MKVSELIEKLQSMPQDAYVWWKTDYPTWHSVSIVEYKDAPEGFEMWMGKKFVELDGIGSTAKEDE
jgi:hypothetical protein